MLPAYTMPPNAEDVKVLRALVKQTLSHEQIDRLSTDIATACEMLEKKGGAHPAERKKMKQSPGY
jgi:glutamate decarboxylase